MLTNDQIDDFCQFLAGPLELQEDYDRVSALARQAKLANRYEAFIRSFLNPEKRGRAVPPHVRDDAREVLGIGRCES